MKLRQLAAPWFLLGFLLLGPALLAAPAPATVEVRLTEYAVEMPASLPAGTTVFAVHNEGKKTHNFGIEGEGMHEMLPASLRPGASADLQVTLKPGKYRIYCPIGSHESKGMSAELVVTAAP
jgi:plastocyanin